jgi:hypothetical protein
MSITVSKAFADNRSVGEIKLPAALFNKTSTFQSFQYALQHVFYFIMTYITLYRQTRTSSFFPVLMRYFLVFLSPGSNGYFCTKFEKILGHCLS